MGVECTNSHNHILIEFGMVKYESGRQCMEILHTSLECESRGSQNKYSNCVCVFFCQTVWCYRENLFSFFVQLLLIFSFFHQNSGCFTIVFFCLSLEIQFLSDLMTDFGTDTFGIYC